MSWPKIWQSGPGNCGKFFGQFEIFIFVEEIDCRFKRNHNRSTGRQIIQTLYIFPVLAQTFLRLNFMQFFGNFDKIVYWRHPRGLVPPPTGNPGSTHAFVT